MKRYKRSDVFRCLRHIVDIIFLKILSRFLSFWRTWQRISHRTCSLRIRNLALTLALIAHVDTLPFIHHHSARPHTSGNARSWMPIDRGDLHMSIMIMFMFKLHSASVSSQDPICSGGFSQIYPTTWIVAIMSSLILRGWWRCRSMMDNTIRGSHHWGSRTWWTTFHWALWWWHISRLPNSPIRARSQFSQGWSSLFYHSI